MPAIWYSYSKSATARSPRTITLRALRSRRTSSAARRSRRPRHCRAHAARLRARTISIRSSSVNIGVLRGVGGDPDDQPVDQLRAAPDDVDMAERDRIEGAGIDADALACRPHRSRSTTKRASARSRSASSPWPARWPIACSISARACCARLVGAHQRDEGRLARARRPCAAPCRPRPRRPRVEQVVGDLEGEADVAGIAAQVRRGPRRARGRGSRPPRPQRRSARRS